MNECEPPFSSSSSYWAVRVSCVCAWRLVLPFNLNTKTVWKYFQNISIQFLPFAFVSNNLIVCLKELKWIGRSKWLCTMDTKTMQELFTFFHLSHLFSKKKRAHEMERNQFNKRTYSPWPYMWMTPVVFKKTARCWVAIWLSWHCQRIYDYTSVFTFSV